MRLEQIVHRVESRLFGLLPTDGIEEPIDETTLLRAEIARRQTERDRATTRRAEVAARLEANTTAAALLPSQIESSVRRGKSSQAMRQALELERLRRELDADRTELPRLDQTIWSLGFRLRQLGRCLADLQLGKREKGGRPPSHPRPR